jgi:hypothetical protein
MDGLTSTKTSLNSIIATPFLRYVYFLNLKSTPAYHPSPSTSPAQTKPPHTTKLLRIRAPELLVPEDSKYGIFHICATRDKTVALGRRGLSIRPEA